MFKSYAHFSVNHPLAHKTNLLLLMIFFLTCSYQLLANEKIEYALGFIIVIFSIVIFAKASDYKRKYLSAGK